MSGDRVRDGSGDGWLIAPAGLLGCSVNCSARSERRRRLRNVTSAVVM